MPPRRPVAVSGSSGGHSVHEFPNALTGADIQPNKNRSIFSSGFWGARSSGMPRNDSAQPRQPINDELATPGGSGSRPVHAVE
jgi:hypothetical protein